ncbi:hypothetical protein Tco_0890826 [Tanacetum coccineum]|uniref:Uncharacterized protein n=1 Tax=Tanacetum coccineum TaxID=301880 RepID=A0ABQ5C759_9ASTR
MTNSPPKGVWLIHLLKGMENDKGIENNKVVDKNVVEPIKLVDKKEELDGEMVNESDRSVNKESTRWGKYADKLMEMPGSQPIGYYLKHEINEKTIEGLVDNHKYNNSLLATRLVLAHAPMYNSILDKYVDSPELGKNRPAFIQGEMPKKMKDPELFTLPCRLRDSNPFDALADLGSCVNLIPLYLFKTLNVGILKVTENILGLADGTSTRREAKTFGGFLRRRYGKGPYMPLTYRKRIFSNR